VFDENFSSGVVNRAVTTRIYARAEQGPHKGEGTHERQVSPPHIRNAQRAKRGMRRGASLPPSPLPPLGAAAAAAASFPCPSRPSVSKMTEVVLPCVQRHRMRSVTVRASVPVPVIAKGASSPGRSVMRCGLMLKTGWGRETREGGRRRAEGGIGHERRLKEGGAQGARTVCARASLSSVQGRGLPPAFHLPTGPRLCTRARVRQTSRAEYVWSGFIFAACVDGHAGLTSAAGAGAGAPPWPAAPATFVVPRAEEPCGPTASVPDEGGRAMRGFSTIHWSCWA